MTYAPPSYLLPLSINTHTHVHTVSHAIHAASSGCDDRVSPHIHLVLSVEQLGTVLVLVRTQRRGRRDGWRRHGLGCYTARVDLACRGQHSDTSEKCDGSCHDDGVCVCDDNTHARTIRSEAWEHRDGLSDSIRCTSVREPWDSAQGHAIGNVAIRVDKDLL